MGFTTHSPHQCCNQTSAWCSIWTAEGYEIIWGMWEANFCVLLSEQFGDTSVRRATVRAMQNGLNAYWKASRNWEPLLQGYGFCPSEHLNFALCLGSTENKPWNAVVLWKMRNHECSDLSRLVFRTIGNNNKYLIDRIRLFVEKEWYCHYLSLEGWSLRL